LCYNTLSSGSPHKSATGKMIITIAY